jgi:hypothetical protein
MSKRPALPEIVIRILGLGGDGGLRGLRRFLVIAQNVVVTTDQFLNGSLLVRHLKQHLKRHLKIIAVVRFTGLFPPCLMKSAANSR